METLTEKVLRYQRTHEGLRDIVEEIAPRVYQFPRRTMGWDEDACGDFYLFVHPRVIRLVDRFHDQGKPFESYLWAVLNWQLRNFARDRKRGERAWNVALRIVPGDLATEARPDGEIAGSDELRCLPEIARVVRSDADRRNFLFLALKCSRMIDPENAGLIARIACVPEDRLLALAATLRDTRQPREIRLDTFRCRRNRAFSKVRLLETEIQGEVDQKRAESLKAELSRARKRMRLAAQRMARVGISPTNREIALVLAVPKGTVDSGLFWLKRKLASVYDPDNLRSA